MIKLVKKNLLSVKRYPYADGLCLPGLQYQSECPKCSKSIAIDGADYYLADELTDTDFDWCCPTFECKKCKWVWEEEFKLKISLDVEIVSGSEESLGGCRA
jgi:hypothetical protein